MRAVLDTSVLLATNVPELEGELPGVKNFRVTVREIGEDIVFLRKIVRGGADQSFGIQVARLAGRRDVRLFCCLLAGSDLKSAETGLAFRFKRLIGGFLQAPALTLQVARQLKPLRPVRRLLRVGAIVGQRRQRHQQQTAQEGNH